MTNALKDRYGFWFWMGWILWFAASFVIAAALWTGVMRVLFGRIEGAELTTTWVVAVFGSWFLLIIPFMLKKERIWKRLNEDQEKAASAWFLGMGVFIGWLMMSSLFWSWVFRDRLHTTAALGLDRLWAKAVIGGWLLATIPFLVLMYRQADKIFKAAQARQTYKPDYKNFFVEPEKRVLPRALSDKLKRAKPILRGGHVVEILLKDGRKIPHVFVMHSREVVGVYDAIDFNIQDIIDVEPMDINVLPAYDESKWIRLDSPQR